MARAKKNPWPSRAAFFAFLLLAVLYGLPSIAYPLAREQAASFYIGREWWQHDLIPYRDAFDTRTPGIHFIYLLSTAIFGAHPYSIRILELLALLGGGSAIAKAAARRSLSAVEIAPFLLLSVGGYFAFVDHSESARAGTWGALCLLGGQSIISIDKNRRRAAIVSGLWTGFAVVLQPQAIFFAPVLFGQVMILAVADRPEPEKLPSVVETTAAYWLGFVQPPAAFIAYFATRDGSKEFYESILRWTPQHGAWLSSLREAAAHVWLALASAGVLWIVGLALGRRQKEPPSLAYHVVAPALLGAAVLGLCVQGVTDASSWVVVLPFILLCAADGVLALGRVWTPLPAALSVLLVAVFHFAGPTWRSNPRVDQRAQTGHFWRYAVGGIDRQEYLDPMFRSDSGDASPDVDVLGTRIRELAHAEDRLHVRGRDPGLYAVSGLRSPSRFFAEADAPDDPILATQPPRFFVTRSDVGSDELEQLSKRGYEEAERVGPFVLFTR